MCRHAVRLGRGARSGSKSGRPNIILVVADDLGWNDVGYHGSEIRTPNIDRLVAEGVRLERFYVAPICTPTRAGLLTGRSPIRYGLMAAVIPPWREYGLPLDEVLLPQALADAGYEHRGAIGKWHLGHSDESYHPLHRGFTTFYGHYNGAIDYFSHEREGELDWHEGFEANFDEGYATDLLTERAIRFIRESAAEPFFLYLAYNAPHTPLQIPQEALRAYPNLTGERRTYAAMVSRMDDGVGSILDALDELGIAGNTWIAFISDNGGNLGAGASNAPLRSGKQHVYEGGIRVPAVVRWPGAWPGGGRLQEPVAYTDLFPTILDVAGASYPRAAALDGRSVLGALRGRETSADRDIPIYWAQNGDEERLALIRGDWKLVYYGPSLLDADVRHGPGTIQLFDLAADPHETNDLAARHPDRAAALFEALQAFRRLRPQHAIPPYHVGREGFEPPPLWQMKRYPRR